MAAARMAALGVAVAVVDNAGLKERYPALNPCRSAPDLITGDPHDCVPGGPHLIETEGGYIEPMDVLQDLLRAVRASGVEVRFQAEVVGVDVTGGTVRRVRLASGEAVACGALVTAAGPWCNRLFDLAGLRNLWSLVPTRIQIVQVDRPLTVVGTIPVCADPASGIYFRSQNRGKQIIVGSVLEEDERERVNPDSFDRSADDDFTAIKLHGLQHRVHGLDTLRGIKGYSGLYTVNSRDVHPIVGATPIAGLYVANGFSGHGFTIAPAIGALVAQAVTGVRHEGDAPGLLDFLAFDRQSISVDSRSALA